MNFVVFSRNFYPQRDPEAYCSTRFASALAAAGHHVHVVTVERPASEFEDSYSVLVDPSLKITRVPVITLPRRRIPRVSLRYQMFADDDCVNMHRFVDDTRRVLGQYEKPILVTRSHPLASLIVGWFCRRNAHRWIAHLSDPIPWGAPASKTERIQFPIMRFWIRRAMRHADLMSVTCKRAIRFYRESHPDLANKAQWVVVTHVGDFKLNPKHNGSEVRPSSARIIAHYGDMYGQRGLELIDAVEALNQEGWPCELAQVRKPLDANLRKRFAESKCCFAPNGEKEHDRLVREKCSAAQVSAVVDFPRQLTYSPYLMSKFTYQVYENRPMVVVACKDSEKNDLCQNYPEAGLLYANQDSPEAIRQAIRDAFEIDPETLDRSKIRLFFSAETVASEFVRAVELLG